MEQEGLEFWLDWHLDNEVGQMCPAAVRLNKWEVLYISEQEKKVILIA